MNQKNSSKYHIAPGGVNDGLLGATYQVKLLMLFAYKAKRNNCYFELASEVEEGDKFDDLVFDYKSNVSGNTGIRFLQAKHSRDKKQINLQDLLTSKNYKLWKYFISYRKIKSNPNLSNLRDLIICTNNGFALTKTTENLYKMVAKNEILFFEKLSQPDEIFDRLGDTYKLVGTDSNLQEERDVTFNTIRNNFSGNISPPASESEIEEFFEKVVFVVNLKETDIDKVLSEDISDDLCLHNVDFVYEDFELKFVNYVKSGEHAGIFTLEKLLEFFRDLQKKIWTQNIVGLKMNYIHQINESFLEFGNQHEVVEDFLLSTDFHLKNRILYVLTSDQETSFSTMNVLQTLKYLDKYQKDDSFLFIKTDVSSKVFEMATHAFEFKNCNDLLIVEVPGNLSLLEAFKVNIELIIRKNTSKKMIVIVEDSKVLKNQFKEMVLEVKEQTLSNLTPKSLETLLGKEIEFQGNKIFLGDILMSEDEELLKTLPLKWIVDKDSFGKQLPDWGHFEDHLYIDRRFHRSIKISSRILEDKSIQDRIVHNQTDFDFYSFFELHKNLHFLRFPDKSESAKENKKFLVWVKSSGNVAVLKNYQIPDDPAIFKINQIIENHEKIVILSDIAGIGKSTTLNHLSNQLKLKFPEKWIIKIDFSNYSDELSLEVEENLLDAATIECAIRFLIEKLLKISCPVEKLVIERSFHNPERIVLIFDGFDEVSCYKTVILKLLQLLSLTKVEKIFVSTRPELGVLLEQQFNMISYQISEFDKEDQKEFLMKNFGTKQFDNSNVESFVLPLVDRVYMIIKDFEKLFVAVPLILKIVAESFEESLESGEVLYTYQFFERFVKKKFNVFVSEKLKQNPSNSSVKAITPILMKSLEEAHQKLALKQLFRNNELSFLGDEEDEEISEENLEALKKCGIVKVANKGMTLLHQVIAEYLVSSWFLERINNKKIAEFLVTDVLKLPEYRIIRLFFDGRLTNYDFLLYGDLLRKNLEVGESVLLVAAREAIFKNFHILFYTLMETSESLEDFERLKKVLKSPDVNGHSVLFYIITSSSDFEYFLEELKVKFGMQFLRECLLDKNLNLLRETSNSKNNVRMLHWVLKNFLKDFDFMREVLSDKSGGGLLHYYSYFSGKLFWKYLKVLKWMKRTIGQEYFREILMAKDSSDRNFLLIVGNVEVNFREILDWLAVNLDSEDLKSALLNRSSNGGGILHYICYFVDKRWAGKTIVQLLDWTLNNFGLEVTKELLLVKTKNGQNFLSKLHLEDKSDEIVENLKLILQWLQQNFPFLEELVFASKDNWNILHNFFFELNAQALSKLFPWFFEWILEVFGEESLIDLLSTPFLSGGYPVLCKRFESEEEIQVCLEILNWVLEKFGEDFVKKTLKLKTISEIQKPEMTTTLMIHLLGWTFEKFGSEYTENLLFHPNGEDSSILFAIQIHSSENFIQDLTKFLSWLNLKFSKEIQEKVLCSQNDESCTVLILYLLHCKHDSLKKSSNEKSELEVITLFNIIKANLGLDVAKRFLNMQDQMGNSFFNFLILLIMKSFDRELENSFFEILCWFGEEFKGDQEFLRRIYFSQNKIGSILLNLFHVDRDFKAGFRFLELVKNYMGMEALKEMLLMVDELNSNFFVYVILKRPEKIIANVLDWLKITFSKDKEFLLKFIFSLYSQGYSYLIIFASIQEINHVKLTIGFLEWIRAHLGMENVQKMIKSSIENGRTFIFQLVLTHENLSLKALQEILRYFKIRFSGDKKFIKDFLLLPDINGISFLSFCAWKVQNNLLNYILYFFEWVKVYLGIDVLREALFSTDSHNKTFMFFLIENGGLSDLGDTLKAIFEWLKNFFKENLEDFRSFLRIKEDSGINVVEKISEINFSCDFTEYFENFLKEMEF